MSDNSNVVYLDAWRRDVLKIERDEQLERDIERGGGYPASVETEEVSLSDMLRLQLWFALNRDDEWTCIWNGAMKLGLGNVRFRVSKTMARRIGDVDVDRVQKFVLDNF